jgi:vancomycin permeability regulator SanA
MNEGEAKFLFVHDMPERAELALVFGHTDPEASSRRARHAARLYREGFAACLLLSGGPTADSRASEAAHMAQVARESGVSEEKLLLEETSTNTFENAERSLLLLREKGLLEAVGTILLVSCPWHMRRVFLVTRQTFPARIRLLACPQEEACTEATWQNFRDCRKCVAAELRLLERFTQAGLLRL